MPALFGHYLSFFTGLFFMVKTIESYQSSFLYISRIMLFQIIYYLYLHPSGGIKLRKPDHDDVNLTTHQRRNGYKQTIQSGLWTTQGRLHHPRPTVPTQIPSNDGMVKNSNNKKLKQRADSATRIEQVNASVSLVPEKQGTVV
jgi:hypothetical protein